MIELPLVIRKMLSSKKVVISILGVILLLLRQHTNWLSGWEPTDIIKPIGGYLFAQGLEDWGKSEVMIMGSGEELKGLLTTLKELFGQRKTGLMLTQLLIGFCHQFAPGMIDDQTATWAINLLMGSTVAIGVSDLKKSAAKISTEQKTEALG